MLSQPTSTMDRYDIKPGTNAWNECGRDDRADPAVAPEEGVSGVVDA